MMENSIKSFQVKQFGGNELPEAPLLEDEINETVFGSSKSIFVTISPSLRTIFSFCTT